jgi:hypothetical protein
VPMQDIAPTDWTRVARVCNSYLGEHWGPPPWNEAAVVRALGFPSGRAGRLARSNRNDELDCGD